MKDGYYISAFVCIDELQNLLDIKLRHDQSIALWQLKNGSLHLIRYWELERISGYKQHAKALYNKDSFIKLLEQLLREVGVDISEIIAFWGTKDIETDIQYRNQFTGGFAFHNIAHVLTSIFYSNIEPFNSTILALGLDAGPDSQFEEDAYDKEYYTGALIHNSDIRYFPIESPARMWSYATKKFGLREGSLMALASATACKFQGDITSYNAYNFTSKEARKSATKIVEGLYCDIYTVDYSVAEKTAMGFDNRFSDEENKISMIMKVIAELSVNVVSKNIDFAIQKFSITPNESILAMAGGFALNCPTNSTIVEKYGFRSYQIPPCTSDTGIALGIGLAGFFPLLKSQDIHIDLYSAYYGQLPGNLPSEKYSEYISEIKPVTLEDIIKDLEKEKVIVWINGNAEIGPRALGNRSLIGDPRTRDTADLLNRVKQREWWRPVAPIVLDSKGHEYFNKYKPSPFMLLNFTVNKEKTKLIPAVIHLDGTARVQSVSKRINPGLFALVSKFEEMTGVAVLCNTSLNDAGEPIVNTIDEAIAFALHKGFKAVYLNGNTKIELLLNVDQLDKKPSLRNVKLFSAPARLDIDNVMKQRNPFMLNIKELTYYFDNPSLFKGRVLTKHADSEYIRQKTSEYLAIHPTGLDR